MDNEIMIVIGFLIAYLIGAIPTSVWLGRRFYKVDVREHGSGNAGATNTFRVLGVKAGVIVLIIDFFKGVGVVAFAGLYHNMFPSEEYFVVFQLMMGVLALIGHMFPVFASFNGGKGVATLAGIVLGIYPVVFLICLGIFIVVFVPSRYVSLSSIISAIAFPVLVIFVFNVELVSKIIFALLTSSILIIAHRKNILRLIKGTENRIVF